MAAAAPAAARDSASRRIETYARPQGRTRAVPLAEQRGFAFQLRRWRREARPDLTDQVLGSDLKSAARESEWEVSDVTRAGPQCRGTLGSRLDVRSPELGTARLLLGREEVKTYVRLEF